jgi:hypothetical protein
VSAAIIPLAIYAISALLLYVETWLISSAMEHLARAPHGMRRRIAITLLLVPLLMLPAVPIVLLLSLDYDCRITIRTVAFAASMWLLGLLSAIPAYLYAKRLKRRRPIADA